MFIFGTANSLQLRPSKTSADGIAMREKKKALSEKKISTEPKEPSKDKKKNKNIIILDRYSNILRHLSKMPLKIAPTPTKLERVFVARLELINREQEATLMALLNDPAGKPDQLGADAARLAAVELGRYSAGGMERAMHLVKEQMRRRFHALVEAETKMSAHKVTATR